MEIDLRGGNTVNYWKAYVANIHDDTRIYDYSDKYHQTCCLSAFTSNIHCLSGSDYNFEVCLQYNTEFQSSVWNYMSLTKSEFKYYLDLLKEYIDFNYKIYKLPNTNRNVIKLKFSGTYCVFMFIMTLVRYAYEEPAAHKMHDVLKLYDYLNSNGYKLDIVNCVNLVLGCFKATHGHQTQCLYPYITNGVPLFMHHKNVLNRLYSKRSLQSVFNAPENRVYTKYTYEKRYNTDELKSKWLRNKYIYLNHYNKWKLKSML